MAGPRIHRHIFSIEAEQPLRESQAWLACCLQHDTGYLFCTDCGMETFTDDVMRKLPGGIPIHGYICDVKSGRLIEVPAVTEAGRAR